MALSIVRTGPACQFRVSDQATRSTLVRPTARGACRRPTASVYLQAVHDSALAQAFCVIWEILQGRLDQTGVPRSRPDDHRGPGQVLYVKMNLDMVIEAACSQKQMRDRQKRTSCWVSQLKSSHLNLQVAPTAQCFFKDTNPCVQAGLSRTSVLGGLWSLLKLVRACLLNHARESLQSSYFHQVQQLAKSTIQAPV